jgi:phosphatidylserine/phosphatidylglycerophosphate/cardiolipin synthase-like enzyme
MARMLKWESQLLCALVLGLTACAAPAAQTAVADTSLIRVFFTNPDSPAAQLTLGGPDEDLQTAIEAAHVTIDVAIYDLNLYNLRDALIDAEGRGVQVRMVIESENFTEEEVARFTHAGIEVVGDGRSDAMHDKFLVIDRYKVWTGSMNYTLSDVYGNRNNMVRLRSTLIAENYEVEFEEMFTQNLFGSHSTADTPNREVDLEGSLIETYFAPEDAVQARLVELVNQAEKKIDFLVYSFTSDELAEAFLAAQSRGVKIRGVMDKAQAANAGGEYERFVENELNVRLDGEHGSLHNKVLIIDGEIVVTGSYNFSANAEERNDENLLVIHDAVLASEYLEEFALIWDIAEP